MAGRLPGGATTVRDIDWDALRLARSKVRGPATRITLQWLHGWLPLNEWLHTFDDKVPGHYCVSCKRLEDQDHLRRCPSRRDLVEQRSQTAAKNQEQQQPRRRTAAARRTRTTTTSTPAARRRRPAPPPPRRHVEEAHGPL